MARLLEDSRVATGGGRGLRIEGVAIPDAFDDAEGVLSVAVIASGAGACVRSVQRRRVCGPEVARDGEAPG
eukprot:CAMPEP_0206011970 /NCGR_PEP_ID=MMETSP1464-20131121/14113_1 /ASSEMBLY_ACC=CAM_ASM_001124 /TAXON_ID=119497 /ORGANISM="Exanthemachrysis gayraliae, Strain RCC1523" /LENGTH=70 /DNA_ID=CAMNT_0053385649 /DNA_START=342 /DNA_END=551 /DNA_ORIENTATION=-